MPPRLPLPPPPPPAAVGTSSNLFLAVGLCVSGMLGIGVISLGLFIAFGTNGSGDQTRLADSQNTDSAQAETQRNSSLNESPSSSNRTAEPPATSETPAESEMSSDPMTANTPQEAPSTPPEQSTSSGASAPGETTQPPRASSNAGKRPLDPLRAQQNILTLPQPQVANTPTKIAELKLTEKELSSLQLDLSSAFSDKQSITTKAVPNLIPRTWHVLAGGTGNLGQKRHDATFTASAEGLMFSWEMKAPNMNIVFSPLKVTVTAENGQTDEEVCQLFKTLTLPPLDLKFDGASQKFTVDTSQSFLPELESLLVRVEHEGFGDDAKITPDGSTPANSPIEISVPDPDFTEEPLLSYDITIRMENKKLEIEIAQSLHHYWVHARTREPEVIKSPWSPSLFEKLNKEKDQHIKTLSQKVERDLDPKIAQLQDRNAGQEQNPLNNRVPMATGSRTRTRVPSSNGANSNDQLDSLLDKRDAYESAILSMKDLPLLEETVEEELDRLKKDAKLRIFFEVIPNHEKASETLVVIKPN